MAGEAIERIYKLTVDGTQAVRAMENIEKSTGDVANQLGALGEGLKGLFAGFVAGASVQQVLGFLSDMKNEMDDLADAAIKLGVSTDDLTKFRFAAEFSGTNVESMDRALQGLAKSIGAFGRGSKETVAVFDRLGVDPSGKPLAQVFTEMADAFSKLPESAEKTATAFEVFGKSGAEIVQTLNRGGEGITELTDQAVRLGQVMSTDAVNAAGDFNDQLLMLQKASQGVAKSFLSGLLPALVDTTKGFKDITVNAEAWRQTGEKFGLFVKDTADGLETLSAGATETGTVFQRLDRIVQTLTTRGLSATIRDWAKSMYELGGAASKVKDSDVGDIIRKSLPNQALVGNITDASAALKTLWGYEEKRVQTKGGEDQDKKNKGLSDYEKLLRSLNQEYDGLTAKAEDWNRVQTLEQQLQREGIKLTDAQLAKLRERAAAIDEIKQKLKDQADIEKGFQDAVARGEKTTETLTKQAQAWRDIIDPMQKYADKRKEINTLVEGSFLTTQEGLDATIQNALAADKAIQNMNKDLPEATDVWAKFGETAEQALGQGFVDMMLNGEASVKDFVDSFLKQMARILLNQAIMGFFKALMGGGSGGGSGGSMFSSIGSIFGLSANAMNVGIAPNIPAPPSTQSALLGAPSMLAASPSNSVGVLTPATIGTGNAAGNLAGNTSGTNVVTYINVATDGSTTTTGDDIALAKKLDNAVKNTIVSEMRPGGILAGVPR